MWYVITWMDRLFPHSFMVNEINMIMLITNVVDNYNTCITRPVWIKSLLVYSVHMPSIIHMKTKSSGTWDLLCQSQYWLYLWGVDYK